MSVVPQVNMSDRHERLIDALITSSGLPQAMQSITSWTWGSTGETRAISSAARADTTRPASSRRAVGSVPNATSAPAQPRRARKPSEWRGTTPVGTTSTSATPRRPRPGSSLRPPISVASMCSIPAHGPGARGWAGERVVVLYFESSARATTRHSWCRTSRCWSGSGPTRGDFGGGGVLPAAVRRGPRGRPDPAGGVRQRDARAARQVPGVPVRRRPDDQPLLRLVHAHGRARQRGGGSREGAPRAGGRGQADHHHRVRRRHLAPGCTAWSRSRGPRSTRSSTWP